MSREIKFRAWDKQQKKMIAVPTLSFGDDGSALTVMVWVKTVEKYDRALVVGETAELMEFTGLLDKNGKEIYEGDILGLDDPKDHSRALVVFDHGAFKVKLLRVLGSPIYDAHMRDWIVIGNLYENPELMEGGDA